MSLAEYGRPLAYELAFWMQGLADPGYPIRRIGDLSLDVSAKFRALGIIALLVNASTDLFYHNLRRSGKARQLYLDRIHRDKAWDDHHFVAGRVDPMVDSIAANDFALAGRLAQLAPVEWREEHEYEDDYCYAQVLRCFLLESESDGMNEFIKRLKRFYDGVTYPKAAVLAAIKRRDQEAFNEAFNDVVNHRAEEIEESRALGQMDDAVVLTNRQIYVEGLALLRLAERSGLATLSEYRFCPALARAQMGIPFPDESL